MSLFLASALLIPPATDRALPATGSWAINYADARCTLSRPFGGGNDRLTFALGTMPGGHMVEIVVIEPSRSAGEPRPATLFVSAPGGPKLGGGNAISAGAKGGGRVTRGFVPRADFDKLRSTQTLDVIVDGRTFALALSQFPAALKALQACEGDLARSWGFDPQVLGRIATPPAPLGSPATWVTDDDYPPGPLRRGEQGVVTFRLDIDAAGRTGNCAVIVSSGFPELDQRVCSNMLRRTRFSPARDAAGVAVPSIFVSRFTWRIPR